MEKRQAIQIMYCKMTRWIEWKSDVDGTYFTMISLFEFGCGCIRSSILLIVFFFKSCFDTK